jgi:hypothetical protein
MKVLRGCKEKVRLWQSMQGADKDKMSDEKWKVIFDHTRNCKQCQKEIDMIATWMEEEITTSTVVEIYVEDVLPQVLRIPSPIERPADQKSIRLALTKAISLFNGDEPEEARMKMNEYILQKHHDLGLTNLIRP